MSKKTHSIIPTGGTIGIIGGGQLGRMSALAAANLGYKVHIFTPEEHSPASQVAYQTTIADYMDIAALQRFAQIVDVVTFEFENIPHESVKALAELVDVRPGWKALHVSQNRIREKSFINDLGIGTAPFYPVDNLDILKNSYAELGGKAILKTTELGYDGKGQHIITSEDDLEELWRENGNSAAQWVLEGFVDFVCEISVVIARGVDGVSEAYIPSQNVHSGGILRNTTTPADVKTATVDNARRIAQKIADALDFVGVMAVEFFVEKDGGLLVNEMAPRPHNSGHWTMDGCVTSQFEQHIRAVCGLKLGNPAMHTPIRMENLIGDDMLGWEKYSQNPNAKLHIYGKEEARAGRKMAHVNIMQLAS